jgi:hypothetical protein
MESRSANLPKKALGSKEIGDDGDVACVAGRAIMLQACDPERSGR